MMHTLATTVTNHANLIGLFSHLRHCKPSTLQPAISTVSQMKRCQSQGTGRFSYLINFNLNYFTGLIKNSQKTNSICIKQVLNLGVGKPCSFVGDVVAQSLLEVQNSTPPQLWTCKLLLTFQKLFLVPNILTLLLHCLLYIISGYNLLFLKQFFMFFEVIQQILDITQLFLLQLFIL